MADTPSKVCAAISILLCHAPCEAVRECPAAARPEPLAAAPAVDGSAAKLRHGRRIRIERIGGRHGP